MASRRKRGPVALRPCLWLGSPFSDVTTPYVLIGNRVNSGMYLTACDGFPGAAI